MNHLRCTLIALYDRVMLGFSDKEAQFFYSTGGYESILLTTQPL